jgi:hypothetical protein
MVTKLRILFLFSTGFLVIRCSSSLIDNYSQVMTTTPINPMTKNISWITCIECVGNWELVVEYNLTLLNKFSWNNLLLLLLFCCFFPPLTLKLNTWRDQFEWTCCHIVQNKLDNLLESFAKVFHTMLRKSCKRGDFFWLEKTHLTLQKENSQFYSQLLFHQIYCF